VQLPNQSRPLIVTAERLEGLERSIEQVKSGARILRSQYGEVPLALILDVKLTELAAASAALEGDDAATAHLINDGFKVVSFRSDRPFSLLKFQEFLDDQLPENVFRAKGLLWFAESPACHVFQLSGKRFNLTDRRWVDQPSNQMVLIGRNLNPLMIQQMLANCLTR
jgi:G3E family GTPase